MGLSQKPLVNFIGFQIYWWACILLQNQALILCFILLGCHLYFHSRAKHEACFLLIIAGIGLIVDSALTLTGVFNFVESLDYQFPPIWLMALWLGFATNVTTLAQFDIGTRWLALSVTGAALAPLSYLAAGKLGAVTFPYGSFSTWLLLVVIWLVLFPALFFTYYHLKESPDVSHS